jgi:DNA gyrase/topoisomerase IV subunit A
MTNSSTYISNTSKEYAIYVCENRAIPKIQDGLKDGQRKALWLLRNQTEKIKTISLAGVMISSNLYLHGDTSAADSIGKLAAPYINNVPLIEGIGTFGTRTAPVDGISAPRYTYVKPNKATQLLVYPDIDLVPLKENYDGSTKEPEYFLPIIPLLLLNGIFGVAVGWGTNIQPHSLSQLIEATKAVLQDKPLPDLKPTYSYLETTIVPMEDKDDKWKMYGKGEVVNHNTIKITELPVGTSIEQFRDRLNSMEENDQIVSYTDDSTDVISFNVRFKRGTVAEWTPDKIIEFFKLHEVITERVVVLDWSQTSIRKTDTETVIREHAKWRLGWYNERYKRKFELADTECNYWLGVKACFDGKITSLTTGKTTKEEIVDVVRSLTTGIKLTEDQIQKIVSLPLYKWATEEYVKVTSKIAELIANMDEYISILKDEKKIKKIYIDELNQLAKLK